MNESSSRHCMHSMDEDLKYEIGIISNKREWNTKKKCPKSTDKTKINLKGHVAGLVRPRMNDLLHFESTTEQITETMLPSHKTTTTAAAMIKQQQLRQLLLFCN